MQKVHNLMRHDGVEKVCDSLDTVYITLPPDSLMGDTVVSATVIEFLDTTPDAETEE